MVSLVALCIIALNYGILSTLYYQCKITCRYGGIHLGPDRFKHINNAARTLLQTSGLIATQQEDSKQVMDNKFVNKDDYYLYLITVEKG